MAQKGIGRQQQTVHLFREKVLPYYRSVYLVGGAVVSLATLCVGFFIKSKIVCVGRLGETQEFTLSGHRSAAGKKGKCVLSSAKIKLLFRTIEIYRRK